MILFLKKTWSFLKNYWYIPVIIIVIIVAYIAFQSVPSSLANIISKRREMHKKEVDAINDIHAAEIEQREKALKAYHKTIKTIEEKYDNDKNNLSKRKKKKIKKIIEETNNDPDRLAKRLSEQMGFEIVYPKDEK